MDELKLARDGGGIAVVTIDRPAKRNAVTLAMWRRLGEIAGELNADPAVRVVILTGAGGCFSAGADISEFSTLRDTPERGAIYEEATAAAENGLHAIAKPTIAAIDGFCVGGGLGLATCCDFRVAGPDARFGIPAARLGIVYALGETRRLVNVVGAIGAKRILFSGEIFGRDRAEAMGLVDQAADGPALPAARGFAAAMAGNAPLSLSGAKFVVNAIAAGRGEAEEARIDQICLEAIGSADYAEGRAAFTEKRPPRFRGH